MNEQVFWALIEASKESSHTPMHQFQFIQNNLMNSENIIVFKFDKVLTWLLNKASSTDLWAAGCILTNQYDKQSFENFRYWLIMQGQRIFKRTLDDPEYLEIFIADFKSESIKINDYQEFGNIAERVYISKTGEYNYRNIQPYDLSKDTLTGQLEDDTRELEDILPLLCHGMGWNNDVIEGNWQSDNS